MTTGKFEMTISNPSSGKMCDPDHKSLDWKKMKTSNLEISISNPFTKNLRGDINFLELKNFR